LINSAGAVTPRPRGFTTVTDEEWDQSIALTLMATIRTTRAALPQMTGRGGGSIVTISSVNAYLPDPLVIDYSAAKAALTNFCKSLSKELGPSGIRVNTISPGPVATALWLGDHGMAQTVAQSAGVKPGDVAAQAAAGAVTGRFTRPEEVADLALPASQRQDRQRHRLGLLNRWRPRPNPVNRASKPSVRRRGRRGRRWLEEVRRTVVHAAVC
jgi:NAD(P)-dependent dehydrogenase (short-subunit alcohol dehydrogenase family)